MTSRQQKAMREGQIRAQRQRLAHAIERVRAYRLWSATGADPRTIPEIPSDNDFRLARGRHG
jgi:hypothetical protein